MLPHFCRYPGVAAQETEAINQNTVRAALRGVEGTDKNFYGWMYG